MPTQQIAPIHRTSFCIGENEILRFPVLRSLPGRIQNCPQDSVGIERNAPASSIGLGIVEFAFVETFHDFDSIRVNSHPTQSCNLSDPQRTHYLQGNDGFCGFWQRIDHTAYILLCEYNRRLPCLFARQPNCPYRKLDLGKKRVK